MKRPSQIVIDQLFLNWPHCILFCFLISPRSLKLFFFISFLISVFFQIPFYYV
jgi:hypothetical protein